MIDRNHVNVKSCLFSGGKRGAFCPQPGKGIVERTFRQADPAGSLYRRADRSEQTHTHPRNHPGLVADLALSGFRRLTCRDSLKGLGSSHLGASSQRGSINVAARQDQSGRNVCSLNGNRTRISALRGLRPKPLDDKANKHFGFSILDFGLLTTCVCPRAQFLATFCFAVLPEAVRIFVISSASLCSAPRCSPSPRFNSFRISTQYMVSSLSSSAIASLPMKSAFDRARHAAL